MLKRILSAGLAALAVVMVVVIATTSADENELQKNGPDFNPEKHEAITQAIEDGDYSAWYALMTENGNSPKILEYINESNFSKFSEMFEYKQKAEDIRAQLGLPKKPIENIGFMGKGGIHGGFPHNEAVISALESGDYNAFVTALESDEHASKMFEFVTEDNFVKFAEMYNLMKEGKKDKAKVIADELGLPSPQMGMMKRGFGQWKGRLDEGNTGNAVNQN